MILHIFPYEKFTKPVLEFINNHFNINEHLFIITDEDKQMDEADFSGYPNYIIYEKQPLKAYKLMNQADSIVMHSMFLSKSMLLLMAASNSFLKKTAWVIWGGDLHEAIISNQPKSLLDQVKKVIKKHIAKKVTTVVTLTKEDVNDYYAYFHLKKTFFNIVYPNGLVERALKKAENNQLKEVETTRILIGNSASKSNNHLETFEYLSKFKHENVEFFVPLSYGDMEYKEQVKKAGREILEDKFHPMEEFVPYEQYIMFLNTIDVAVFNIHRQQQALGNIRALLYLGAKVYLQTGTSMAMELSKTCDIYSYDQIKELDFAKFITHSDEAKKKNKVAVRNIYDQKKAAAQMEELFTYLTTES